MSDEVDPLVEEARQPAPLVEETHQPAPVVEEARQRRRETSGPERSTGSRDGRGAPSSTNSTGSRNGRGAPSSTNDTGSRNGRGAPSSTNSTGSRDGRGAPSSTNGGRATVSTNGAPQRVRVTGPPRRTRTALPRATDLDAETQLASLYLGSLLRAQLGLALRILAALVVCVGGLPLLFHVVPALSRVHVLGLPLAWLLLGVAVYPFLVLLGWRYVRRAEQNEADFAALLARQESER